MTGGDGGRRDGTKARGDMTGGDDRRRWREERWHEDG